MNVERFQNEHGQWRIRISSDGGSFMYGVPMSEEFLVPEARRFHKRLGDLIASCERGNAVPLRKLGDY